MKTFLIICTFVVAILGASAMVYALDYTGSLSLSLSEQYNDNIFLGHSDKVSDYITSIAPMIALSTRTDKGDALLNFSPTFNFFKDNSFNNNTAEQASYLGHYRVTEALSLGLTDTFLHTRESSVVRTVDWTGPLAFAQGQETITTNNLSGDLAYKLTGKITLSANAGYTYTETSSGIGNVSTYTGGPGLSYLFNERTTVRVNATYTLFDYKDGGNSKSSSYIAGINYKITPTIVADGFGGAVITKVDQPSTSVTGFTGGLSITKSFTKGTASLSFAQTVIAGFESTTPVKLQTVTIRYAAPVTAFLDATIAAFYDRSRQIGGTVSTGVENNNRNDYGWNAELSYRVMPWLSAMMSYSYINSEATVVKSDSYINNIIMLGIKLSKQAKF
jgi:hypothetical protein